MKRRAVFLFGLMICIGCGFVYRAVRGSSAVIQVDFEASEPGLNWNLQIRPQLLGGYAARVLFYSRLCGATVSHSADLTREEYDKFVVDADFPNFTSKEENEIGHRASHQQDCISITYFTPTGSKSFEGFAKANKKCLAASSSVVERCKLLR